jgi:hypothetical protein
LTFNPQPWWLNLFGGCLLNLEGVKFLKGEKLTAGAAARKTLGQLTRGLLWQATMRRGMWAKHRTHGGPAQKAGRNARKKEGRGTLFFQRDIT